MSKAEIAAEQIREILDDFHLANSQIARHRSEVATLQGRVRSLESLNEQIMREKIHLVDYLDALTARKAPPRRSPPEVIESEVVK